MIIDQQKKRVRILIQNHVNAYPEGNFSAIVSGIFLSLFS